MEGCHACCKGRKPISTVRAVKMLDREIADLQDETRASDERLNRNIRPIAGAGPENLDGWIVR